MVIISKFINFIGMHDIAQRNDVLQVEIVADTLRCVLLDSVNFTFCYVQHSYEENCESDSLSLPKHAMSHLSDVLHFNTMDNPNGSKLCYVAVAVSKSASLTVILRGTYKEGIAIKYVDLIGGKLYSF